jgi:hypothetical protein
MAKVMTLTDFCSGVAETSRPNPAINPYSTSFSRATCSVFASEIYSNAAAGEVFFHLFYSVIAEVRD